MLREDLANEQYNLRIQPDNAAEIQSRIDAIVAELETTDFINSRSMDDFGAVSYTHLTLPTSDLV